MSKKTQPVKEKVVEKEDFEPTKEEVVVEKEDFEPTLVYRCPGSHPRKGGTYDYVPANDQDEYDLLLKSGFHATLPEAVKAYELDKKAVDK